MEKAKYKKTPEDKAEILEIREIEKNFELLIQAKQSKYDADGINYEMEGLLVGTPYEKRVTFKNRTVEFISFVKDNKERTRTYQWIYTKRVGSVSAFLTETQGF